MIKISFLLVLPLISISLLAQKKGYEQIAVDYFFDSIFTKYKSRVIEFSDSSEVFLTSFKTYSDCFKESNNIRNALNEPAIRAGVKPKIFITLNQHHNIKSRKVISKFNRLRLKVYLAQNYNSKFYVLIEVYKKMHYTDAYMFEFDIDNNVLRYCKSGVVH